MPYTEPIFSGDSDDAAEDDSGQRQGHNFPNVPRSAGTVGMWLFLAALFMLFVASIFGYVFIRFNSPTAPPLHTLHFPKLLYLSTALVLGVSVCIAIAQHQISYERRASFRFWLTLTLILAAAFIAVQTPALLELVHEHLDKLQAAKAANRHPMALFGLAFAFILLHALHVLGGVFVLVYMAIRGYRGAYDHEHYLPVRHVAMYWHFLDVVWLVMFSTFFLLG